MSMVVGTVEEVTQFNSSAGLLYGIKVNGENYGTYKTKPACNKGDTVSFRFKANGNYKNVDMKTLEIQAGVPQVQTVLGPLSVPAPREPYVDKQPIIARQAALNTAVAFLDVLVAAGAVPGIGKTTKPEEAYGILEALLNEKADEFYTASMAGVAPGGAVPDSSTAAVEGKAATDGKWQ